MAGKTLRPIDASCRTLSSILCSPMIHSLILLRNITVHTVSGGISRIIHFLQSSLPQQILIRENKQENRSKAMSAMTNAAYGYIYGVGRERVIFLIHWICWICPSWSTVIASLLSCHKSSIISVRHLRVKLETKAERELVENTLSGIS